LALFTNDSRGQQEGGEARHTRRNS